MDAKIVREPAKSELDLMVYTAFPAWKSYRTILLKGGLFNTTYRLESDDAENGMKYILRVGPVHRELLMEYELYLMDAEAWAYEKMAEVGIPTSTVVWLDTSKKLIDRDFMIVEYIPSRGLNRNSLNEEGLYKVFFETGKYCRMMNHITTEKFGRVGQILHGGGEDTWSAFIKKELESWAESFRKNTTDYYTEEELQEVISVADWFADILDEVKTPCFNHCDMWSLNVLLPDTGEPTVCALIDPDRCCMGDPDFELASGWMMNDAFYDGYGRRIAEDEHTKIRVELYRMMFCIHNGYFMWVQYDDKNPAAGDKERAERHLAKLREYRDARK